MARLFVVDPDEGGSVPFLRGILTRSLRETGLSFDEAYGLAADVRDELAERSEVTRDELRAVVLARLAEHHPEARARYERKPGSPAPVFVRGADGHRVPFSRGQHRASLRALGLTGDEATRIAAHVVRDLAARPDHDVDARELKRITWQRLLADLGDDVAGRYLVWESFKRSGRPLVVLLGGTDGCGKSTVATALAPLLGIMRTQSTDILRAVMRVMLPERLLPFLHASAFQAWESLPARQPPGDDPDAFIAEGYLSQAEILSVACGAAIRRALQERVSLVIEGIHVHPRLLGKLPSDSDAIVVPALLAVLSPKELRRRLKGRSEDAPDRIARRYLENFDSIWRLQAFLLSEADRAGFPIVVNDDLEQTLPELIGVVHAVLAEHFEGTEQEAFGGRKTRGEG